MGPSTVWDETGAANAVSAATATRLRAAEDARGVETKEIMV